jgi:hypothetical protein
MGAGGFPQGGFPPAARPAAALPADGAVPDPAEGAATRGGDPPSTTVISHQPFQPANREAAWERARARAAGRAGSSRREVNGGR